MWIIPMKGFAILLLAGSISLMWGCKEKKIDFSAQVKPILNKHCISCHGGVKRSANFSVLFRNEALDTTESGKFGIVPGDLEHSEMIRRITSTDPEVRMPYKEEPLSPDDIDILKKWIEQGAEWGDHWAYVAPKKVEVPGSGKLVAGIFSDEEWVKNEIDYFILEKIGQQGLKPSAEADKAMLIRRVYLDLIGLPPTEAQAEMFLNDKSSDAYEKVVDELLLSPHFGEKWASWWLDMARYSDTKGYERDAGRTIWRYRDWVIRAFNQDIPFDQFSTEQLAGDLLPNPSDDQLIATAFHRNTMSNDEGGTEDEEFRVAAVVDRVSTTWEIWQSTTMGCVQCHTHPYDPFVHEEYYESMAFFNNTRDEDTHSEHPNLRTYKEDDQQKLESVRKWIREHAGTEKELKGNLFLKSLEPKYHPHDFDEFINGELIDTKWLGIRSGGSARLKQIKLDEKTLLFFNYWNNNAGGSFEVRLDKLDGVVIGQATLPNTGGPRKVISIPLKAVEGRHDLYFVFHNSTIPTERPVCSIDWFAFRTDLPGKTDPAYADINQTFMQLLNAKVENTPIMIENDQEQRRPTRIFERGNWLTLGEEVEPNVPESLNPFPDGQPYNRLGFAKWLFSEDNPLTARAAVNRFWEQIFGYGIVETLEDFGTQGATPTHGALLDFLALRFMHEHQWSVKKLLKEIAMSATYRQDSRLTDEHLEKDPTNIFLARGPRVRLSAEQVRDQALAASGLLSKKVFGRSVMPYQPEGIWNSVYNGELWKESEGEDRYRRSVYTYGKRTSPYPSLMMFDGSSREVCVTRRIRTNTPLQALVTLNDSSFVVAARHFAINMMRKGKDPVEQIKAGYKTLLVSEMPGNKVTVFRDLYEHALERYSKDDAATKRMIASEEATPELAAMTVVANAMLNLDEVIMKE
ncbi:MAG: DUF1553 domain-containing protein [Cyclobacteriaceae bacterium]